MGKFNREDCVRMLLEKQAELNLSNETRYPKRADFENEESAAIKAFLGPWPRALEAAGIKPVCAEKRKYKKEGN